MILTSLLNPFVCVMGYKHACVVRTMDWTGILQCTHLHPAHVSISKSLLLLCSAGMMLRGRECYLKALSLLDSQRVTWTFVLVVVHTRAHYLQVQNVGELWRRDICLTTMWVMMIQLEQFTFFWVKPLHLRIPQSVLLTLPLCVQLSPILLHSSTTPFLMN